GVVGPPAVYAGSPGPPPPGSGLVMDADDVSVDPRTIVAWSRGLVVFWALLLSLVAWLIGIYQDKFELPILVVALGLASMVQGGLFAAFLLAWLPLNINGRGLVWAAPLSLLCVASLRFQEPWANVTMWVASGILLATWIGTSFTDPWRRNVRLLKTPILVAGCAVLMLISYFGNFAGEALAWPWWALVGGIVAFVWGYLLADKRIEEARGFPVEPIAP
ncbi:MAG: hypothetical protein AAGD32_12790, partial [Planctomycetota bacterium]